MTVKLVWVTPNGDQLLGDMARVSNAKNQGKPAGKLIKYLIDNKHWSPLEMVNACVEIGTTRDIARQILRHRSFSFQEFSQRYAVVERAVEPREARLQDHTNRQNSITSDDETLHHWWKEVQQNLISTSVGIYNQALDRGIAKEVARAILPEGLTPSVMYMNGSLRSWVHYWSLRCDLATQKEHRVVAEETRKIILPHFPSIAVAVG
jgi:thymidylate synthase (FAD)